MTHLFLLYVLVNGQIQSSDMYFYDINRCNYFANAIVRGKVERTLNYEPRGVALAAYCLPPCGRPRNSEGLLMDPVTIAACISGASRAYNMVAKAVNAGREIEDTAQYIGKFFDSKEKILEIEKENQYGPKLLRGSSVEAQALEIQMAKHKTQQMESQLREIIVLYGPGEAFYNEMMKTRRTIRAQRLAAAEARAKRKRMIIDGGLILGMFVITVAFVGWSINLVTGAR
jgi:hypothetical protein